MAAVLTRVVPGLWTALVILVIPLQAVFTRRLLAARRPTPMQAYAGTAQGLAMLGAITLAVDLMGPRVGVRALLTGLPVGSFLAWTFVTLAACVAASIALLLVRRVAHRTMDPMVAALLPRTTNEHRAFFGVSLLTGLSEEYVMRGFCLGILIALTRSPPLALVLVTLSFGLAHGYQGWLSMIRATALGAILAVPVVATGALGPSMVAHAAVNMLAATWLHGLAKRWGVAS